MPTTPRRPTPDRRVGPPAWLPRSRWLAFAVSAGLAAGAEASITGVCPDGSVFVVSNPADIPCRQARRVEPHQVPPMRPENLPRSYLWEVYREKQNENNPYNLVDRAEKVRGGLANQTPPAQVPAPHPNGPAPAGAPGHPAQPPQVASAPPVAKPQSPRTQIGLTDGELRDLFYLVELSQQQVPATFTAQAGGQESMRVSFARSQAFEHRARGAVGAEGSVVLWSVQPSQRGTFRPNFTFVQGQTAFRPQAADAHQLGVLVGRVGEIDKGDLVLGYAVLPASIDLSRSIDVYWDDRRLAATFGP